MRTIGSFLAVCAFSCSLSAQMSSDQRVQDFQTLVDLYAKRYAPYDWKKQAIGFDLFQVSPWLDRVRNAKDDLEYYEIAAQYVASFQDTHSSFRTPSSFAADLGLSVDIYDGKVLIESINRRVLPVSSFPIAIGDELVSIDGQSADDLMAQFSQFRRWGSPLTTRRNAASMLTFRPQSTIPRAVELGDTATVVIRNSSGDLATYALPWTKSGVPLTNIGPVPGPFTSRKLGSSTSADIDEPPYLKLLDEMRNWALPADDPLFSGETVTESGEVLPRRYVLGLGSRNPVFRAGLPPDFVQRLGSSPVDFHFSGTYQSGGYTIGYLRVPNFSPNPLQAMRELEAEISYFQANTDGLVVDVMRNPGGGCYMNDLAAHLIPHEFYFFGELVRVTLDRINSAESAIEFARLTGADQWIIDTYQNYLDQLKHAYAQNRGMTDPIPACNQSFTGFPPSSDQMPASIVYTKPIIILVDEFSISAADIFPAMMQDNHRGVLVGMRTSGGGGSISTWPAGYFSEAVASNTNSLVVRNAPVVTSEYPAAPYVENIGARPDITLDYMTRDNLLNGGASFVSQFTAIIVDQIKKGQN